MDAVLKKRLIGAVVIVALAVVFIPMFFEKNPAQTYQQTSKYLTMQVPASNEALVNSEDQRSITEAVDRNQPQTTVADNASNVARHTTDLNVTSKKMAADIAASMRAEMNPYINHPDVGAAPTAEQSPPTPVKQTVVSQPPQQPQMVSTKVAATAKPMPTKAVLLSKTIQKTANIINKPQLHAGWAIQLGSFSSNKNAKQLLVSLKNLGFAAYMRRVQAPSGAWHTRVYVGPKATKDGALVLLKALKSKVNLTGVVIAYQPRA